MSEFFDYQSAFRKEVFLHMNLAERLIPLLLLAISLYLIYKYRDQIKQYQHEKWIRYSLGILLFVLFTSHYTLRIIEYGLWDSINIPFHLCSFSMMLSIYLFFQKENKAVFSFLLIAGILGAMVSLLYPVIGYTSSYYRYYQFYIGHSLLVVAPMYFMFVHGMKPTQKDVVQAFITLQVLALFMTIFNYYNDTDFMFLFIDPRKIENYDVIRYLGGIPYYLIVVELVVGLYFYGMYRLFKQK